MLANTLATILAIITGVVIAVLNGGHVNNWLLMSIVVVYFGIAQSYNASRRHAAKGEAVSAPVIDDPPEPADKHTTRALLVEQDRCPADTIASDSTEARTVGRIVDGRLMLSQPEIKAVRHDCKQFANVLEVVKPAGAMNPGSDSRWYLVLSRESAVFMDESGQQIWTVNPSGLRPKRHPISNVLTGLIVESVDGRKEIVNCTVTAWPCVFAWMSNSHDEYLGHHDPSWPNGWGLFGHELITGNSPRDFLRWQLPYANTQEGIRLLEQEPHTIPEFVKRFDPETLKSRLASLGCADTDSPLMKALHDEKLRRKRNITIGILSFGVVMAFIGVWIPYMNRSLPGSTAAAIFLTAVVSAVGGSIWAHTTYLRRKTYAEK